MTDFETRSPHWLSVQEALGRVLAGAVALGTERIPVQEAVGRALAQDVRATATLPPWDNSAMDGYAVRTRDIRGASRASPIALRVQGEVRAGEATIGSVQAGWAVRVMTGAPVPSGADSVVRVEDTDAEAIPGLVMVFSDADAGRHIRPRGQDMMAGEELLSPGVTLGPGQIGLLAASGIGQVAVVRRPRVAILSNGDELAAPGEFQRVIDGRAIPETNSAALSAAVSLAGGVPIRLGIARDTPEDILEGVRRARAQRADVLITSGGASMGERDLVKRVLERVGFELDFWRVRMRPGTPFSFGSLPGEGGQKPLAVFGLPGNPASSFVTFQVFCRPFILRAGGHLRVHRTVIPVRAGEAMPSPRDLTQFFRVTLRGDSMDPEALLTGSQTSGLVRSQGLAQGLAVVRQGRPEVEKGDRVPVILLDDFGLGNMAPGYLEG